MKNPYIKVEQEFNSALAVLAVVQDGFVGDNRDRLNDEIIFFALESVRRELHRAREILTKGTFHEMDYPTAL